jgi:hypothetical protein
MKGALEMGRSVRRASREGSFTGDPGRYVKALDTGISVHVQGEPAVVRGARIPGTVNDD